MTDLRQMLQLNKSYVRSFVSVDEQLQSGLLPQSVSLQLLARMSLACSLSTATVFCEVTWQGQAVTARRLVPLIRPTGIIEYSEFTLTLCTWWSFLILPSDMRC